MTNHPNRSKQQQAKHTPWHVDGLDAYDEAGMLMCHVRARSAATADYELAANRIARIVACVNSHEELLAALKAIIENATIAPDGTMSGSTDIYTVPLDDIGAAKTIVAKAEGK